MDHAVLKEKITAALRKYHEDYNIKISEDERSVSILTTSGESRHDIGGVGSVLASNILGADADFDLNDGTPGDEEQHVISFTAEELRVISEALKATGNSSMASRLDLVRC